MTDRVLQVLGQWLMERGRAIRDWRFVEAKVAMDVVWSTLCVCVCVKDYSVRLTICDSLNDIEYGFEFSRA